MSADPDSFDDSLGRIGPDIHDNLLVDNSINGLFVRVRTQLGESLDRLVVPARWDDTDVVHVVSENLLIGGTPGGPVLDAATGDFDGAPGCSLGDRSGSRSQAARITHRSRNRARS